MEDDGGQYLISPVDPEIRDAMRRVLDYFKKAHKIKATKLNIKKMKKSLSLWLANMACIDEKDFSYELTDRKGHLNIWLELVKMMLFMSNHTLVALLTAVFEKFGIKRGSEKHAKLMQQSKDLYQEFKVQSSFLYQHFVTDFIYVLYILYIYIYLLQKFSYVMFKFYCCC